MKVSTIGFGGSALSNFYADCSFDLNKESIERIDRLIEKYFQYGVNYFDTAPWYHNSEYLLGQTLAKRPRNSYYLATKIGRYNSDKAPTEWFDYSYNRVQESVENSIKLLNCDYIDLIQVHDFEFALDFDQIINETLPALDELRKQGRVRYIGINSYSIEHLKTCLEKSKVKIDTILTFCHACLDDSSLLDHTSYFREKNVGILNASPMSMGVFTDIGPPKWHPAPKEVKDQVRAAFEYCKANNINLKKLAFNYSVLQPDIDITISSTASEEILDENMRYFTEGFNESELESLQFIREKFFKPLNYKGFGDVDVKAYLEAIKKA